MKEFRELPATPKELNESIAENKIFSSELTRREADDKIAKMLEEYPVAEVETPNEREDIGNVDMTELARRKRLTDAALDKWNLLDRELRSLKSKRNYERDAVEKAKLDKKISAKQSEVDSAKREYESKLNSYQAYARRL